MRKRRFTKQVGVLFDEDFYKLLIEVTDELEVSVSEFIRNIVKEKFNSDEKGEENMVLRSLTRNEVIPEEKFKEFILELQDYLKTKLTPVDDGNGNIYWTCEQDHTNPGDCDAFRNCGDFCKMKKLNHEEIMDMIDEYSGEDHFCECDYVNHLNVDDSNKAEKGESEK